MMKLLFIGKSILIVLITDLTYLYPEISESESWNGIVGAAYFLRAPKSYKIRHSLQNKVAQNKQIRCLSANKIDALDHNTLRKLFVLSLYLIGYMFIFQILRSTIV